ncbi:High-affinity branched-chain amino acid transport system permease protein LivH (TC 3.A.1.4.1) [[Actinomadura] parvosata subsp. kistnae]|uniref:Branched-chain amino acid ABC transporter permease n=1 Tax=[Actinomadura] parvosata subsp. kistnae TaxID=1909395 RepID=A0A1U9ZR54_9ACTN|nr:branched-chain amino acid ABC transporter permease [Nonomuraea sp. ATCC 55076]AQZ60419.1 branched-chain amino acid ABC transporter permease [Nonomuraea sp. ATCC 55076]SPL91052.1 High-affinity branched-chain amino acid transport system permease protein LivH (TC 3.A.1.4.1) [Actinomadura parvosata subsp. kistnae]
MKGLLETLIRGLGNGSVYALLALGFVIIYKATRVISFAQPALMLAGGVAVSHLTGVTGFYPAVLLSALLIAGVALAIERVAIRPMVGRPVFVVAIITLGIDVVVRVVVNAFIGRDVRQVGDPWGFMQVSIGPLVVQTRWLAMMAATAVLVGLLFAFFRHTRYGLAMRAAAFDQETALAQGVSVGAVFALSWGLAGFLAAIAGMFVGTGQGIEQMTWVVALKALPAIIVGGLDSLGGAVAGGLVVGVVESLFQSYQGEYAPWLGQNFAVVSPYVVMLVVLLVRPYGLFGTREVERV